MGKRALFLVLLSCSGPAMAQDSIILTSAISAPVERSLVQPGDLVRRNDLLLTLHCPVQRAQLAEARAFLTAITKRLEVHKLTSSPTISVIQAEYQTARDLQDQADRTLSLCRIIAPIDGIIVRQTLPNHDSTETSPIFIEIQPIFGDPTDAQAAR